MKKFILILSLFLSCRLSSQAYQPFDSTTVWNTLRTGEGNSPCYPEVLYSYFVMGYVVNNGYTWYKVYANISAYRDKSVPFYNDTCPPLNNHVTTSFMGMFNNDSVNKKVYFVTTSVLSQTFVPGPACLEFDFNGSIGSSIQCYNSGVGTLLDYSVTAIDSILFDGKYHKRFIGANSDYLQYVPSRAYFIEGIGASCGVFYSECDVFQGFSPLLCFSGVSNSKYLYGSGGYPTSSTILRDTLSCNFVFTTGFPSLAFQSSDIKIYPNPSNGLFHISIENSEQTGFVAHLSDISSREIKTLNLDGWKKDQQFDINDLNAGIYLLSITKDKSIIYTTKLIKQE